MIDLLPEIVDGFIANILAYAVLLAAVATITMALLELAKAVFHLRLLFHLIMIKLWLKNKPRFEELLILSIGENDSKSALLDQPTDKLLAQIQAAANVVIDYPSEYPEMYEFLTYVPRTKSMDKSKISDSDIWKEFSSITNIYGQDETAKESTPRISEENKLLQQATRARARLDHFIARKLDAFQTRTEYKWARLNQFLAITGSIIFLCILLTSLDAQSTKINYSCLQIFFLSIFGGMLAPFAKDVVTALSNVRTK